MLLDSLCMKLWIGSPGYKLYFNNISKVSSRCPRSPALVFVHNSGLRILRISEVHAAGTALKDDPSGHGLVRLQCRLSASPRCLRPWESSLHWGWGPVTLSEGKRQLPACTQDRKLSCVPPQRHPQPPDLHIWGSLKARRSRDQ